MIARVGLLLLVGGIIYTGRGLIIKTPKRHVMTAAQAEIQLVDDTGWGRYVKDVHCQAAQKPFDYACTYVNYGTARNTRLRRGGTLLKTGVIDVHGHVVTGQSVGVNDPLGPAPRSS